MINKNRLKSRNKHFRNITDLHNLEKPFKLRCYTAGSKLLNNNSNTIHSYIHSQRALTHTYSTDLTNSKRQIKLKIKTKSVLKKLKHILQKIKSEKQINSANTARINQKMNFNKRKNFSQKEGKNENITDENNINKNKLKQLRFKVHSIIKNNYRHLCDNFINKTHLLNEKIMHYYLSEHYKNSSVSYRQNFHYKNDIELKPKINMYTDLNKLDTESNNNKLDFKKCFSAKEQKLILLDPNYYFQKDNPNIFKNVNIVRSRTLTQNITEEDQIQQIKKILSEYLNYKKSLFQSKKTKSTNITRKSKVYKKIVDFIKKNNIQYLSPEKLSSINLLSLSDLQNKKDDEGGCQNSNNKRYDYLKTYNKFVLEANRNHVNKDRIKKNRDKEIQKEIEEHMRNCQLQINYISKDRSLVNRKTHNLFYDREKDEKNEFNIITKQMLIEQNYEYLSKFEKKKKEIDREQEENLKNKKKIKKSNGIDIFKKQLSEQKEKNYISIYLNKIKNEYNKKG